MIALEEATNNFGYVLDTSDSRYYSSTSSTPEWIHSTGWMMTAYSSTRVWVLQNREIGNIGFAYGRNNFCARVRPVINLYKTAITQQ